jgi:cyclophilin family peptidyl-prolyl cis-trans isomerase
VIAALALLALQAPAEERVVLRTSAGDVVLFLDRAAAPRTVEQFLRLVRLGVYDGSTVSRIEPGYLVQFAGPYDRRGPLSEEQKGAVRPIPREPNPLRHTVWSVTMARPDEDPDGGLGSFSILLNDAPHLDGGYTVFGRVAVGFDVVDLISRLRRYGANAPRFRIEVESARAVGPGDPFGATDLRGASVPPEGLAAESVLLRTNAGDIVLSLYPDVAPNHVARLLTLVRSGVYESSDFGTGRPGEILQLSGHSGRRLPMTDVQAAAVGRIPAEFSMLPHRRGTLTMAREDDSPDSAETSFCILLGPAPQLDRRYTVFGHVREGLGVADVIAEWKSRAPAWRAEIKEARVIDSGVQGLMLFGPSPPSWLEGVERGSLRVTAGWLGVLAAGVLVSLLPARLLSRRFRTVCLLGLLVVGFGLFGAAAAHAPYSKTPLLPLAVFLGGALFFRIMGGFEGPRPGK